MKILLDECVDWRLKRHLPGHEVKTAQDMGWATIKNGELLKLAAAEFEAFVTVDRNLSFQQNTSAYAVAIIVLQAKTNRLSDLTPLTPRLLEALKTAQPSEVTIVGEANT